MKDYSAGINSSLHRVWLFTVNIVKIIASIPYTNLVNGGHRVESSIVTLFLLLILKIKEAVPIKTLLPILLNHSIILVPVIICKMFFKSLIDVLEFTTLQ